MASERVKQIKISVNMSLLTWWSLVIKQQSQFSVALPRGVQW